MGPVEVPRKPLVYNLIDERALARARDAGHAGKDPEGDVHIHIFEVVNGRASHLKPPGRHAACLRHRHEGLPGEILAGDGLRRIYDVINRADRDQLPAVLARARTDIHDAVRSPHRILVVLDHDQRVAEVPQSLQRREQLVVVPLVKTDARLIQNIGDAHKTRPDLGRQSDALCLTARERSGRPGERQIVEADIPEEGHAGSDLL